MQHLPTALPSIQYIHPQSKILSSELQYCHMHKTVPPNPKSMGNQNEV